MSAPARACGAHETEVPLRWSDVDVMNHVNNVHYADFADEARLGLVERGLLPGTDVAHVDIEYLQPVPYGAEPLVVRTRLEDGRLLHELHLAGSLRARIAQRLGPPAAIGPFPAPSVTRDLPVRHSDRSQDGVVRPASWTGLVQEARVALMSDQGRRVIGPMVIARYELEIGRARELGHEVRLHGQVARVGRSSSVVWSEVLTGHGVGARAASTIVAFDPATERPRPWTDTERELLEGRVRPS